jgi:hypothetical protein
VLEEPLAAASASTLSVARYTYTPITALHNVA